MKVSRRPWLAIGIGGIAFVVVALIVFVDAIPGTLRRTKNGYWGTGTYTWTYKGGRAMRVDEVYRGRETQSTWYRPDGTVVARSPFRDGSGTAYFLYEDGTVRTSIEFVNSVAHGTKRYFATDGTLLGEARFENGVYVSGYKPPAKESKGDAVDPPT